MTSYKRIDAAKTTIDILKFMAQEVRPVSGKEIAQALGKPHGTVMCYLVTLEDGGFVKRVYDRYEIGVYLGVVWESIRLSRESRINAAQRDLGRIGVEK